jgi:hypothetical protein
MWSPILDDPIAKVKVAIRRLDHLDNILARKEPTIQSIQNKAHQIREALNEADALLGDASEGDWPTLGKEVANHHDCKKQFNEINSQLIVSNARFPGMYDAVAKKTEIVAKLEVELATLKEELASACTKAKRVKVSDASDDRSALVAKNHIKQLQEALRVSSMCVAKLEDENKSLVAKLVIATMQKVANDFASQTEVVNPIVAIDIDHQVPEVLHSPALATVLESLTKSIADINRKLDLQSRQPQSAPIVAKSQHQLPSVVNEPRRQENRPRRLNVTKHLLVVKPRQRADRGSARQTQREFREVLADIVANLGIVAIKPSSNHSIKVEAKDAAHADKIVTAFLNAPQLANKFVIERCRLKSPTIVIIGAERRQDRDKVTFAESLIGDNPSLAKLATTDITVLYEKKSRLKRDNLSDIIVQLSPTAYSTIVANSHLQVALVRCRVDDYVNITQCYRCLEFGHHANSGRCLATDDVCSHCGVSGHRFANCPTKSDINTSCCSNCTKNNIGDGSSDTLATTTSSPMEIDADVANQVPRRQAWRRQFSTQHSATALNCPHRQAYEAIITSCTNFGPPPLNFTASARVPASESPVLNQVSNNQSSPSRD